MGKHIVFIGAGAVGGYVGAHLARAGEDVALVDPWPDHVEAIKRDGMHLGGSQGEHVARVKAMHMHEVQSLVKKPVDIAIICTKSYDSEWAAQMITQYLAPRGYIVSMQNGINEERIAGIAGWGRTVGCALSTISVDCFKPGYISRYQQPGGERHTVFRVGEVHGRITQRVTELAFILGAVDSAKVTQNLWGERWTKLTANSITHGILGATGLDNRTVYVERGTAHRLGIRLAAEAIAVGRAQGFELGSVLGIAPDDWRAADSGSASALKAVQAGLTAWMATLLKPSQSSVGRDLARGRRSEIEFTNGLIAARGEAFGVPAPAHAALTALVKRIDAGELNPDPKNIESISC